MEKAIKEGYMTVGEVAKKMKVTVRTLQHYDKEGLLAPSAFSEGGRRLYTDKDLVRLHQILALKQLGFSLEAIKSKLSSLDTPDEVAEALEQQASAIREKISDLTESLREIEALKAEVLAMQSVDFQKYADIIVNLSMKNEFYWMIKHFDDESLSQIRGRFDQESSQRFMKEFVSLQEEAIRLAKAKVPIRSEQGQRFAKAYWELIQEFTGGDLALLSRLMEFGQSGDLEVEWQEKQALANTFIGPALDAYFSDLGLNPLGEVNP